MSNDCNRCLKNLSYHDMYTCTFCGKQYCDLCLDSHEYQCINNPINKELSEKLSASDNPIKTALAAGCQIKVRLPTKKEKANRLIFVDFILPGKTHQIDIKGVIT